MGAKEKWGLAPFFFSLAPFRFLTPRPVFLFKLSKVKFVPDERGAIFS